MNFETFVILPAGGCGQRTGLDVPKQFVDVLGRPLIVYTLETFQSIPWITKIIVAVAPDWEDRVTQLVHLYRLSKVDLVSGGTTRHRSIQNAVRHLRDRADGENGDACPGGEDETPPSQEPVVIVHDAVRPFADEPILRRVSLAAEEYGAAGSVLPLVSTIIESDPQDVLVQSLVRSKLKESHTPQAFRWSVLDTAYRKISEHDLDHGTEVLDLALKYTGCRAKLVEAPDRVWKVTYKKDFVAAESFAKVHGSEVFLLTSEPSSSKALPMLRGRLTSRNLKVSMVATVPDVTRHVHTTVVLHLVKPSPDEAAAKCQQCLESLVSTSGHGGLLVCLCHLPDGEDGTLGRYRRLVNRLAAQGSSERVRATFVVYTATERKEQQTLSRACDLTASVIFDRNPLMSGQLFVLSDQD